MKQHKIKKYTFFMLLFLWLSVSFGWEQTDTTSHQGRIWNLRESGQESDAKALERHVQKTLRNVDFLEVKDLNLHARGISNSFVVNFPNKMKALLKGSDPDVPNSYNLEVAAYRLDKLLKLNFVPVTEVRDLNGVKYSIQLMYPVSDISMSEGLKTADNQIRLHDLTVFDFLLGNVDRILVESPDFKLHNFLIGADLRLIAIDHARSFDSELYDVWGVKPAYEKVSLQLREKIQKLDPEKVKAILTGLVPPVQLSATLERLQSLKATFKNLKQGPSLKTSQKKEPAKRFVEVQTSIATESNIYYTAAQALGKERAGKIQLAEIQSFMNSVSKTEKALVDSVIAQNWHLYTKDVRRALIQSDLYTSSLIFQMMSFPENKKNAESMKAELDLNSQKTCSAVFAS